MLARLINCTGLFSSAAVLPKINSFQNVFEGYHQNACQTVRIQIRPYFLSGLILVQTVCKGYQQISRTHLLPNAHMQETCREHS